METQPLENTRIGDRLETFLAGVARRKGWAAPGKERQWVGVIAAAWIIGLYMGLLISMNW
jgi:hypothetical protein